MIEGDHVAFQDMGAFLGFGELVARTTHDDVFLVGDVVVQRLLQGEHAGHAVDEREHDDAEAHLQLRVLIQLVEHHLRDGVLLQLDDDVDAVAIGAVVDVRDLGKLLLTNQLAELLEQALAVHLVRDLRDHDGAFAVLALFDLALRAHGEAAATRLIGIQDALLAHDDAAGREIRAGKGGHELGGGHLGVVEHHARGVDGLAEVVRRDVGGHADGDAVGAVDQQAGEARGQDRGLLQAFVIVGLEVDRFLVEVAQQLHGGLAQAGLGVTHCCGRVAVDGAEVSMAIDERNAHAERLGQANHGVVHGGVTVRVILADDVADGTGGLHMRTVRRIAGLVHGVQDAAMDRLQAVAHVGQGAADDDAHGILQERRCHFLAEICRTNGGAFAAVCVLDDRAVGVGDGGHVDERAGLVFLGHRARRHRVAGLGLLDVLLAGVRRVFLSGIDQALQVVGKLLAALTIAVVSVICHSILLDVQESNVAGVLLDELLARLDLIAHELADRALGLGGIVDAHLQKRTGSRLHGGFPQLLGIHLAQALVALHVELLGTAHFLELAAQAVLVVDVALDLRGARVLLLHAEDGRASDVDVAAVDELGHIAVEERQQQDADVRAVDVGIGHDDDAVVTRLIGVEVLADVRADGRDERTDGVAGQGAVQAGTLDVQDLTAQRQDGLRLAVARLLGAATCGIALYNEDFGLFGLFGRAVRQLTRQRERVEHALAARHLAGLTGGLAGLQGLRCLADDALGRRGVLLQVFGQTLCDGVLDKRADLGVAELRLRLALELRVVQLHGDDGGQALAGVVTGEVVVLLLQDALAARILVDGARDGLLEAVEVRAALVRVDVVGERHDGVRGERRGPLHGHLDRAVGAFGLEIDGLVQRFAALVEVRHEIDDAAFILEDVAMRLGRGARHDKARVGTLVGQRDLQALVQEGHLAETRRKHAVVVNGGLGEDLGVGPEGDRGAGVVGGAHLVQLLAGFALLEGDLVLLAITTHVHLDARGQRVHNRHAHAMQATGHLVSLATELAAGMQHGQDDLYRGNLLLGVLIDRDAAAIVGDGDGVVGVNGHLDMAAVTGQSLVDRVVHNLVNQVMETARARGADIHARTFANRFKAFEDLNVRAVVMIRFCCH